METPGALPLVCFKEFAKSECKILRSKAAAFEGELIPGVADRPPGKLCRPTKKAIARLMANHEKKLRLAKLVSYSGCCTRCERSCVTAVIFIKHWLTHKLILIFRNNLNVYH
jgi:hypothetical protein